MSCRLTNMQALLAQVVGEEPGAPCESCVKELGPWALCVTSTNLEDVEWLNNTRTIL